MKFYSVFSHAWPLIAGFCEPKFNQNMHNIRFLAINENSFHLMCSVFSCFAAILMEIFRSPHLNMDEHPEATYKQIYPSAVYLKSLQKI